MTIAKEEIFGPVLSVIRVRDLDEALARSTLRALAMPPASSPAAARPPVSSAHGWMRVWWASTLAWPRLWHFSFRGWKGSFFGDLHATGKDGVRFYTETRVVIERW